MTTAHPLPGAGSLSSLMHTDREFKKSKTCQRCGKPFSLLHRAHHCRQCKFAVCSACSSHTMPIYGEPQRVCDVCFNAQSLRMYRGAEEKAREKAALASADVHLAPPPKHERRAPLKLAIPASLSHLQGAADIPIDTSQPFASPLSPQFESGAYAGSPTSTSTTRSSLSSRSAQSLPGSEFSSPAATPTHGAGGPPMKEGAGLPSIPSVAALASSTAFASFKNKVVAFHGSIAASEAEWERRLGKDLRAKRPDVRNSLAHVSSIVETMKKEQQRRESAGLPTSQDERERLAYFVQLRSDYAHQLDRMEMDMRFPDPTMRRYKLRVNAADENFSIAAEDLALERVSGVLRGEVQGSRISMELSDVQANVIVYNFAIAGQGARVWGNFLRPERVSLQLTIRRILIPLTYHAPANSSVDVGRWAVDRTSAVFDLHVVKTIKGSATVPDSFVAWIIDKQVPKALLALFEDVVPGEVGQLFTDPGHHVTVHGAFDVKCSFSNSVWEADLSGNGVDSEAARQLLIQRGTSESSTSPGQLHARMHLLTHIIQAARLHRQLPALTLHHVSGYIRRYSCSVDKTAQELWLKLLTEWQLFINELEGSSSLWFFHFIERVAELDDKPLVLHFALNKVSVGVGVVGAMHWYLDTAIRQVQRKVEEEKKKRAAAAAPKARPPGVQINGSQHSLLVPSRTSTSTAASAPTSPLTSNSASTSSPSSKRSALSIDEEEVDSLSNFLADGPSKAATSADKDANKRPPLEPKQSRARSSSHPQLESPRGGSAHSNLVDHAEESAEASAEAEEVEVDLSDVDPDSLMTVALDWHKTVQASLAAALDIVKSLSLNVSGQLTGGPAVLHPPESEDAQVSVWVSRVNAQLTMPPLKLTVGALEMIKESIITTPQMKIATRVNPQSGSLESLTQLTDPRTGLRYTYHFALSAGALNLFPALLAHQQQQIFASSLSAPPAVTFTLEEIRLDGPVKPALEYAQYITFDTKQNVIRAVGSAAEKAAEVQKQDEEERVKQSLISVLNASTGPDLAGILLPYITHKDHSMSVVVKLQLRILNTDASSTAVTISGDQAGQLPSLVIPEDNPAHVSGSHLSSAEGSVTSISLLSSTSSVLAISTAELQEKLQRYRHVVLTVDTPSAGRMQAMDEKREEKGQAPPKEIVLDKNQQRIQPEEICVDVSFKATLVQLITDVMQLTLG